MIRTPSRILGATLKAGESVTYDLSAGRLGYLVLADGSVTVEGGSSQQTLGPRDGLAIKDEPHLTFTALSDAELVFADLHNKA